MPDDPDLPRKNSPHMRFIGDWGYDRGGEFVALVTIAYVAACVGAVWLIAAVVSHFARH